MYPVTYISIYSPMSVVMESSMMKSVMGYVTIVMMIAIPVISPDMRAFRAPQRHMYTESERETAFHADIGAQTYQNRA
jgi:hypothetical protein